MRYKYLTWRGSRANKYILGSEDLSRWNVIDQRAYDTLSGKLLCVSTFNYFRQTGMYISTFAFMKSPSSAQRNFYSLKQHKKLKMTSNDFLAVTSARKWLVSEPSQMHVLDVHSDRFSLIYLALLALRTEKLVHIYVHLSQKIYFR